MVTLCDFVQHDGYVRCQNCDAVVKASKLPVRRRCDVQPKPGLGDMVKAGLSAIGITEERVSKALGRPCGCSKRAEALNELGRRIGIG